jgi:hypothetical protein
MTTPYFILTKDKKYLKPDGTISDKKEEAATYSYNKNDNSIKYQDSNGIWKSSDSFFRDQVCAGGCSKNNGYCKGGKCFCVNSYTGNNCEIKPVNASTNNTTIIIIIVVLILLIGSGLTFYMVKKKKK